MLLRVTGCFYECAVRYPRIEAKGWCRSYSLCQKSSLLHVADTAPSPVQRTEQNSFYNLGGSYSNRSVVTGRCSGQCALHMQLSHGRVIVSGGGGLHWTKGRPGAERISGWSGNQMSGPKVSTWEGDTQPLSHMRLFLSLSNKWPNR